MNGQDKPVRVWDLPQHSADHLAWRLESVRETAAPGWFLFDGRQIGTIVQGLRFISALPTGEPE